MCLVHTRWLIAYQTVLRANSCYYVANNSKTWIQMTDFLHSLTPQGPNCGRGHPRDGGLVLGE